MTEVQFANIYLTSFPAISIKLFNCFQLCHLALWGRSTTTEIWGYEGYYVELPVDEGQGFPWKRKQTDGSLRISGLEGTLYQGYAWRLPRTITFRTVGAIVKSLIETNYFDYNIRPTTIAAVWSRLPPSSDESGSIMIAYGTNCVAPRTGLREAMSNARLLFIKDILEKVH